VLHIATEVHAYGFLVFAGLLHLRYCFEQILLTQKRFFDLGFEEFVGSFLFSDALTTPWPNAGN